MSKDTPHQVCLEHDFHLLFKDYSRGLRDFIYYKCGENALAEDLAQEAFLRLWRECRKVPYEKAKSFLFTVANHLVLDEIKHRKVVARFHLQKPDSYLPATPEEVLEEEEFRQRLEAAISALPVKSREVFLMNRIEKMTYAQIAGLLEISVKAVEKRMHRALSELRKLSDRI